MVRVSILSLALLTVLIIRVECKGKEPEEPPQEERGGRDAMKIRNNDTGGNQLPQTGELAAAGTSTSTSKKRGRPVGSKNKAKKVNNLLGGTQQENWNIIHQVEAQNARNLALAQAQPMTLAEAQALARAQALGKAPPVTQVQGPGLTLAEIQAQARHTQAQAQGLGLTLAEIQAQARQAQAQDQAQFRHAQAQAQALAQARRAHALAEAQARAWAQSRARLPQAMAQQMGGNQGQFGAYSPAVSGFTRQAPADVENVVSSNEINRGTLQSRARSQTSGQQQRVDPRRGPPPPGSWNPEEPDTELKL